jgi:SpoVK/Ycf46/Vps4 family AAA+-type ATPase
MRVSRFKKVLGHHGISMEADILEAARRFRLGAKEIEAVGIASAQIENLDGEQLHALCRTQVRLDLGNLAQKVIPRFKFKELVLPPPQALQLSEIVHAMNSLTRVHYSWGTARAWNDAGLSVLFCGPPGTGKTMAAEAIAEELRLPMFRIDLSQVVNKYIGETEKNLKKVFDAAEESDCVIFFDEADALFGKRTSVKDAHDRFANIEISYLLERMERLKGIAILATNRRKDLDEAFLRRLRYLVEFPLPGEEERARLWKYVFPSGVNINALDIPYLARTFALAGGHIRSIAFNACLQTKHDASASIDMTHVLSAVKRELDKLNRPNSPESFGKYEKHVKSLFEESAR